MEIGVLAEIPRIVGDLNHQFTGRRDDKSTRLADVALLLHRIAEQVIDDGYQEGSRFAGACLCPSSDIMALKGIFQALCLDRGAILKSEICYRLSERVNQIEG